MPTVPPAPSGEQHGEQVVTPSPPVLQGIQPPTGLNLSAKNKPINWKIYKQHWENYSIVAQLENQPEEYRVALFLYSIHRMQIWRTTRSSPGKSYMKARLVSLRCFVLKVLPQETLNRSCFVVALFCFISLCLQVPVFLNATRRDRNLPPFSSKGK